MANEKIPLKVFLCHASQDKPKVRDLYDYLFSHKIEPWLDEKKLVPGQDWKAEIEKAIKDSDAILICLSRVSVSKVGYVNKEIRFALDKAGEMPEGQIFLIPVRFDACDVPTFLDQYQWVDQFRAGNNAAIIKAMQVIAEQRGRIVPSQDSNIEQVEIPEGAFWSGVEPAKYQGRFQGDSPYTQVVLPAYQIGKYPVTVGEYRQFFKAGGYKSSQYWTQEGWRWREQNKIKSPMLWENERWTGDDSLPVIGVSWYEAIAYCHWLNDLSGKHHHYRLPSLAEWEKAARGTDGRLYPYGDLMDAGKCNVADGGIGRTTPVRYFPAGASPYGVVDMSGNVLEWCASRFIPGNDTFLEKIVLESNADRTLRGGCWAYPGKDSRCTLTWTAKPHQRDEYRGFRVACDANYR